MQIDKWSMANCIFYLKENKKKSLALVYLPVLHLSSGLSLGRLPFLSPLLTSSDEDPKTDEPDFQPQYDPNTVNVRSARTRLRYESTKTKYSVSLTLSSTDSNRVNLISA